MKISKKYVSTDIDIEIYYKFLTKAKREHGTIKAALRKLVRKYVEEEKREGGDNI